jgi:translation initiation factor 4E
MAEGSEAKDAVEREHELNRKWTLWFSPATAFGKGGGWTQALEQIYTFGTVEDFWRLFNNVQSMSKLPPGSKYNYFQDGVQPAWEDPVNKDGGHWEFETTFTEADEFWMKTVSLSTLAPDSFRFCSRLEKTLRSQSTLWD